MTFDAAPGGLEQVRSFLNTWELSNTTREPVDHLDDLHADAPGWATTLPAVRRPGRAALPQLHHLRTALRDVLGQDRPQSLSRWLVALPLKPVLVPPDAPRAVTLVPVRATAAAELLALAVNAMADGDWHRLRACPGCDFVFFDSSRNGSRTWCRMTREDEQGRSCGSLAKARAKRARDRAAQSA